MTWLHKKLSHKTSRQILTTGKSKDIPSVWVTLSEQVQTILCCKRQSHLTILHFWQKSRAAVLLHCGIPQVANALRLSSEHPPLTCLNPNYPSRPDSKFFFSHAFISDQYTTIILSFSLCPIFLLLHSFSMPPLSSSHHFCTF